MDERERERDPDTGDTDTGVEAERALRNEDQARSDAKWERIGATWREPDHNIDADDVTAAPPGNSLPPLDWDF